MDCAFYRNGACETLINLRCVDCKFYKTKEQHSADKAAAEQAFFDRHGITVKDWLAKKIEAEREALKPKKQEAPKPVTPIAERNKRAMSTLATAIYNKVI